MTYNPRCSSPRILKPDLAVAECAQDHNHNGLESDACPDAGGLGGKGLTCCPCQMRCHPFCNRPLGAAKGHTDLRLHRIHIGVAFGCRAGQYLSYFFKPGESRSVKRCCGPLLQLAKPNSVNRRFDVKTVTRLNQQGG